MLYNLKTILCVTNHNVSCEIGKYDHGNFIISF